MFESAGRIVYRGRWTLLVLSLALAVLAAPFGMELFGRMVDGGFDDPKADSTTAARWNDVWYSGNSPDVVVLYRHPKVKVADPRFKKAVHDSLRRLPAAHVRKLATYWTTASPRMVSKDEHSTYALITLRGGPQTKQRAYAEVKDRLAVENLQVKVGGSVPLVKELNDQTGRDLARAEAISMPVLLVLLVIVFGSLVAAGLPLLVGLLSVLGALALLRLLTEVTEVSVFSLNVVTMLGLGLAIDYSLFVLSAFREEVRQGATNEQAVVRTMATAGRTVAFSGLTVATSLLGLLLFPQMFLRSIGLGAAAVVLVAMLSALVVLPAVLGVLGRRVDAVRVVPVFTGNGTFWRGIAASVMKKPGIYLVGVMAVLVALALPFAHVKFGNVDHRVLPAAAESRQVAEAVDRDFARNSMAAIDVHVLIERHFSGKPAAPGPVGHGYTPVSGVTPVSPLDAKPFADRIDALDGVTGVDLAGVSQANGAVRLSVRYDADPMSARAQQIVTLIRSMAPEPNMRAAVVGGPTAAQMDLMASLTAVLPWMALVVGGVTFVLLFMAFGSVVLPLKALLMNVLSIGASFGVIVWAFQDGHLAGALGFTPTGTIEATVTVLILAVVFGLSMDYEVFLLSRVRTEWLRTQDNAAAVALGLEKTGGIITSAALLLLVVIGAFSTAGITIVKLLGVGMFAAIVVDATLVRALLVPATMRLMGGANWWLPRWLHSLHTHLLNPHTTISGGSAVAVVGVEGARPRALGAGSVGRDGGGVRHSGTAGSAGDTGDTGDTGDAASARVIRPNPDGPGWYWESAPGERAAEGGVSGRVVFGADTDPEPVAAEHEPEPPAQHVVNPRVAGRGPLRKLPYSRREVPAPAEDGEIGWVKVTAGRTRVVRAVPGGWVWAEVES
ncbi:MMPL family transporter [Nonomuraea endophytica]|uniref:RND superfamily putative drug exporter n=1 Tax=Nonomuraea endophytica TaxID=714136 RepID=A0A7W8ADL1_9ACTN|nr:MMPL family transporter [Nonomuraea endophytica]MBB5083240.1 RND superfamily putative drug exporter [Nonomuraea endophytica]